MALPAVPALVRGAALLPLLGREAAMSAWRASNGQLYTYEPPHQADLSLTEWLDKALAAEEHRQGMAYGDDADHCGDCAAEALRRRQAACEHGSASTVEITGLGQPRRQLLKTCRDCGLSWREEGEWL